MKKVLVWLQKNLREFGLFFRDEPHKIAAFLIGVNSLGQLALSQTHIEALIRVKLTVSTVGATNFTSGMPSNGIAMFNFMFILFGLVAIFNALRATTKLRTVFALLSLVLTFVFGTVYILKLTNPDSVVLYSDVADSMELMIYGFIIYGLAALFQIYQFIRLGRKRKES